MMFSLAISIAFWMADPTWSSRPAAYPTKPFRSPTVTTHRNFTRRPESVIRWTMLMSRTSSSSPGRSWSTISGSFSGSPESSAADIVSISPSCTLRPSRVTGCHPPSFPLLIADRLSYRVEVFGEVGRGEDVAVERLVVLGDVLAACARPVRENAVVVRNVEASVDRTLLHREHLAARCCRVEAEVEHCLFDSSVDRARAGQQAGQVRRRKVPRRSLPAVLGEVARVCACVCLVALGSGSDQLRPGVRVARSCNEARLARFQQAQPLMVVRPDLPATSHRYLIAWSCCHYSSPYWFSM